MGGEVNEFYPLSCLLEERRYSTDTLSLQPPNCLDIIDASLVQSKKEKGA